MKFKAMLENACLYVYRQSHFGTIQHQVNSVGKAIIAAVHLQLLTENSVGSLTYCQANLDEWKHQRHNF